METGKRRALAVALAALAVGTGHAGPLRAAPDSALTVFALDGETRLRRSDDPAVRGQALPEQGGELLLQAFPGETAAFQIALLAGARPVAVARLEVDALVGGKLSIPPAVFREHYLPISRRSFNEARPEESLGWTPAARPRDTEMLGEVPDALVPSTADARAIAPGPHVPAGRTAAFWVDVTVPETAQPGEYTGTARAIAEAIPIATFAIRLRVRGPVLPYRATSAFAYYEPDRLVKRLGAAQAPAAERQLWQLLHAHRLDAIAPLADPETAMRLQAAYDGSLFRPDAGYHGPGVGAPPAVVALGTYGALGDASPASFARLDAVLASLPLPALRAADLFVYAIDERCASARAGEWRRLLAAHADPVIGAGGATRRLGPAVLRGARVLVGQTCDEGPSQQDVDVALLPAAAFTRSTGEEARRAGRRAWIYNGSLPRTGTLLLDADPRGLTANGWIAAVSEIERWFYWESTFWDDDNRGGRGAIDPFVTAESFHNTDGDTALGDGLLLYPGTQTAPFSAHSLGQAAVLPSLRLKALRRGLEDAAIIALAAREHPDETARLIAEALPAALDEAPFDRPASWAIAPKRFGETRAALRALVTRTDALTSEEIRAGFGRLAATRRRTIAAMAAPRGERPHLALRRVAGALAAMVLAVASVAAIRRRRRRPAG